jgi:hypothetical protein
MRLIILLFMICAAGAVWTASHLPVAGGWA